VKYTTAKAIQLVASATHQVAEPAQAFIQFLENSTEMSHYHQQIMAEISMCGMTFQEKHLIVRRLG
jgi:hypothetical protein